LRRWSNCTVEIFAPDGTLERREADCDVRLGERDIVISYFDDEGPLVFSGPNDGSGRFDLHCRSRVRRVSMRLEEDESRLEGSWSEDGEEGSWRILLPARAAPRSDSGR
jgi:hypothetical protein